MDPGLSAPVMAGQVEFAGELVNPVGHGEQEQEQEQEQGQEQEQEHL